MLFTLVDVIIIGAILVFGVAGFFFGLITAIGALIGVVAGAWLAGNFYLPVADWLSPFLMGHDTAARIIAFILIFTIVNRLVALVFWLINKVFKLASLIPFLGMINRLAGALLGILEGILATGLLVYAILKIGANITWLAETLDASRMAHSVVWLTSLIAEIMPAFFGKM